MENIDLNRFIEKQGFSDSVFADVFKFIVNNYPDEDERKRTIRTIIEIWQRRYPNELGKFNRDMKKRRELNKNEFASDKDNDIRILFSIPQSLLNRINMVVKDPKFLSKESDEKLNETEWFLKEFPQFRAFDVY